jgi:endogenous inhibitor of DNA gyrase (YacG/DUF329 family)
MFGEIDCARCGNAFIKKRQEQRYCSTRCRNGDAVGRHRKAITRPTKVSRPRRSDDKGCTTLLEASNPPSESVSYGWGKVGDPPLHSDYPPLEYYGEGFPKIPNILKRPLAYD